VGPGLRGGHASFEEPTRDPDVWPNPPPRDPAVWDPPTQVSVTGIVRFGGGGGGGGCYGGIFVLKKKRKKKKR
jgi:hypothetical protein